MTLYYKRLCSRCGNPLNTSHPGIHHCDACRIVGAQEEVERQRRFEIANTPLTQEEKELQEQRVENGRRWRREHPIKAYITDHEWTHVVITFIIFYVIFKIIF